jgi:hypothetical protein
MVFKFVDPSSHHVAFISSEDTLHLCNENSYTLSTPPGSGFHYLWNKDGVSLPDDTSSITITQSGNYFVTVFNAAAQPQISDTVYVSFDPLPVVEINNVDTFYCTTQTPVLINVSPVGGELLIDGTADTTFLLQPAVIDTGDHIITYAYTDPVTTCSSFTTQHVRIEECLSVDETGIESISLYPVPANDRLILKTGNIVVSEVEIIDMAGRKILSQKNEAEKNNLIVIDVSKISAGMYAVKIKGDKRGFTKKLVIE